MARAGDAHGRGHRGRGRDARRGGARAPPEASPTKAELKEFIKELQKELSFLKESSQAALVREHVGVPLDHLVGGAGTMPTRTVRGGRAVARADNARVARRAERGALRPAAFARGTASLRIDIVAAVWPTAETHIGAPLRVACCLL